MRVALPFRSLLVHAATRGSVVRSLHVEQRLTELGVELPPLGVPKGSYVRGSARLQKPKSDGA